MERYLWLNTKEQIKIISIQFLELEIFNGYKLETHFLSFIPKSKLDTTVIVLYITMFRIAAYKKRGAAIGSNIPEFLKGLENK